MDKFILITKGNTDSMDKGVVRLSPSCYEKIYWLKQKTGMTMRQILDQCVDFALFHLDEGNYKGADE